MPSPPLSHSSLPPLQLVTSPGANRSLSSSGRRGSQPFCWSCRLFPRDPSRRGQAGLCPRGKGAFPHPAAHFHRSPRPRPEANSCSLKHSAWVQLTLSCGYGLLPRSRCKAQSIWCRICSLKQTPRDPRGLSSSGSPVSLGDRWWRHWPQACPHGADISSHSASHRGHDKLQTEKQNQGKRREYLGI